MIVTQTDRDFVDLTVKKLSTTLGKAAAGLALAAAALVTAATPASADTSTLTTTYHHPFYDVTQSAFVDAVDLHPGDRLQTADGTPAEVTSVRAYHQTETTYDLTINGLHTYYVEAGDTSILVHNVNTRYSCSAGGDGDTYYGDGSPGLYERPAGTPTKAQRDSVQGKPCVDCNSVDPVNAMHADHIVPLVVEWYNNFKINLTKAKSLDAVQPQCRACSGDQGSRMAQYARRAARAFGFID
ncbi:polymorphic toxin-type HINT domain-containing protein [Kutzneria sp. NPDC052558]|uniref:polymorphic toxin-type HINT domain-containing protein n=1 Tax=Kutzneria sp. NPDC052558 TaxID=3364121 RepID=UPI0037C92F87